MSQLLQRLKNELYSTADASLRAEIMARIAGNSARQGKFVEAKDIVAQTRKLLAGQLGDIATVWVMLAEGLILFFEQQSSDGLDRIKRAQALGISLKYSKFIAISSAWRAHIEFDYSNYVEMAESLALVQQHANNDDYDAKTRMALVLFSALALCGNTTDAQKWFLRAHDYAVRNGDQISIESLMYNRASLAYTRLRVERCAYIDESALTKLQMEISSSNNLNKLVGSAALSNHVELINARILIIKESYSDAVNSLNVVRHKSPFARYHLDQDYVDLEICYCNLHLKNTKEVNNYLSANHERDFPHLDIDEQIVAAWMLWQMSIADQRFGDPQALHRRFDELYQSYTQSRAALLQSLQPFIH